MKQTDNKCGSCVYYVQTDNPDSVFGFCTCDKSIHYGNEVLEYMNSRCGEHKKA